MITELLFELTENIVKIERLDSHTFGILSAIMIVLPSKVLIVDGIENINVKTYNLPKRARVTSNITDCFYISSHRSFLVILNNSSLFHIPQDCQNTDLLEYIKYPSQPLKIFNTESNGLYILFDDGSLSQSIWKSNENFPLPLARNHAAPDIENEVLYSSSDQHYIIVALKNKNSIKFLVWKLAPPVTTINKTNWVDPTSTTLSNDMNINSSENITSLHCYINQNSYFITTTGNTTAAPSHHHNNNNRIIKISYDNNILFEKSLSDTLIYTQVIGHKLYLIFPKKIEVWCMRYGIVLESYPYQTSSMTSSTIMCLSRQRFPTSSSQHNTPIHLYICQHLNNDIYTLHKMTLPTTTTSTSTTFTSSDKTTTTLGAILLARSSMQNHLTTSTKSSIDSLDSSLTARKRKYETHVLPSTTSTILSTILAYCNNTEKSSKANISNDKFINNSLSNSKISNNNNPRSSESSKDKKGKRWIPLQIPPTLIELALHHLTSITSTTTSTSSGTNNKDISSSTITNSWKEEEWCLLSKIVLTDSVSLRMFPTILSIVIQNNRLDILLSMLQHIPDLTEKNALSILLYILSVNHELLSTYTIERGQLNRVSQTNTYADHPSSSLMGAVVGGGEADEGQVDTKKKKKKRKSEKETSSTVPHSIAGGMPNITMNVIQILQLALLALFNRASSFSTILLVDSLKEVPPRICVLFLHTLAAIASSSGSSSTSIDRQDIDDLHSFIIADERMRRAVTWMHAILDAHFTSFALEISANSSTRIALLNTMNLVRKSEENMDILEHSIGCWSHIVRSSKLLGGGIVGKNKQFSLYDIDQITF